MEPKKVKRAIKVYVDEENYRLVKSILAAVGQTFTGWVNEKMVQEITRHETVITRNNQAE